MSMTKPHTLHHDLILKSEKTLLLLLSTLVVSMGMGGIIAVSLEIGVLLVIALVGFIYLVTALKRVELLLLLPLLPPALLHWKEILAARIFLQGIPISVFDVSVLLFFAAVLARTVNDTRGSSREIHFHPAIVGLSLITIIGLINGLARQNDLYNILTDIRGIIYFLIGYTGAILAIRDAKELQRAVSTLLGIGALTGITALRIAALGPFGSSSRNFLVQGVYAFNQVGTSYYYAPALLLAIGLEKFDPHFIGKTTKRILFLFFFAGLAISFSRGVLISVATALLISTIWDISGVKTFVRWIIAGLLVTAVVWQSLNWFLPSSIDTFNLAMKQFTRPLFEEGESGFTRLAELRADILSVHGIGVLIGNGIGARVSIETIAETGSRTLLREALLKGEHRSVHNEYGWFYLKFGILGVIALVLSLYSLWLRCWREVRDSTDSFGRGLSFAGLLWITYLAVFATNSTVISEPVSIYNGVIFGIIDLAGRGVYQSWLQRRHEIYRIGLCTLRNKGCSSPMSLGRKNA